MEEVTIDFVSGKEYWVSDLSRSHAVFCKDVATYICTVQGNKLLKSRGGDVICRKYVVDPEKYAFKKPETTEMTLDEVASKLRELGVISGKLVIKENS